METKFATREASWVIARHLRFVGFSPLEEAHRAHRNPYIMAQPDVGLVVSACVVRLELTSFYSLLDPMIPLFLLPLSFLSWSCIRPNMFSNS